MTQRTIIPFLKWAGGKRWFAERHADLLPPNFDRYVEPFLGGGAVFFEIEAQRAILSDLNPDLIKTYQVMRDHPGELALTLKFHQERHSKEYYYEVRANKPENDIDLASWFIYLNRTCWNGLYRVNLRNQFNVPIGTKSLVVLPTDDFVGISNLLRSTEILCMDFEAVIDRTTEGDFVFVDPPYTVKHNLNGFVKYNNNIFSWSDQMRLRDAVQRAAERGAKILVTNANHHSVRELYDGLGNFIAVSRSSVLAADAQFRANVEELVVRTWA